jgi:F0F1-type ATP synthase delta subunit
MTISHALAQTIIAYTEQGVSEQESVERVFSFMDTHGLSGFKPAVQKYVKRLCTADKERTAVRLYTAYQLSPEDKAGVLAPFNTSYTVEEIIDQTFIGGFRTEHNYQFVDATTAHALTRLKQHLLHP